MPTSALRDDDERVDLRPSPWTAHAWIMGCLLALAFGFFIAAWPDAGPIERAGLILLSMFAGSVALIATAMVAVFRHGRAPLLVAYATTIVVVTLVLLALAASP